MLRLKRLPLRKNAHAVFTGLSENQEKNDAYALGFVCIHIYNVGESTAC